jgi:hypothetical protein
MELMEPQNKGRTLTDLTIDMYEFNTDFEG